MPLDLRVKGLPLTQTQRDLLSRLPYYSSNAAGSYAGALCVYHGPKYTDRPSHLAYAARDVVDHLARERQDDHEKKSRLDHDGRVAGLKKTFDPVTGDSYGYGEHYRVLVGAYETLSEIAHRRDPGTSRVPFETLPDIERALHDLCIPQAAINKRVDAIMAGDPTDESAAKLVGMIPNWATLQRIIDRLPPSWLYCMERTGFFKNSDEHCDTHRYLLRCAREHPSRVVEIISSYDPEVIRSRHPMYMDFLDCARQMPPGHAAAVIKFMEGAGLSDMSVHYPAKYLGVATSMCLGGECGLAIDTARRFLTLKNINYGYPGPGWLDSPVREFAGAVMEREPLSLLSFMADLLEDLVTEYAAGDTGAAITSMHYKRPVIEESDQNIRSFESYLVAHMRDCIDAAGRLGHDYLRQAVGITKRKDLLIYRRLEMYAFGAFPDAFRKEAAKYAVKYLDHPYLYHEHYVMLQNGYCSMDEGVKNDILGTIMGSGTGRDGEPTEFTRWRYLECIRGCLDGRHEGIYRDLVKKHGEVPHPGYRLHRGPGRIRPEQEPDRLEPDPLEGMDTAGVIEILRARGTGRDAPDDGLLAGFRRAARADPEGVSARAMDLAGADPRIWRIFFDSMRDALHEGRRIDWDGTTGLMRRVGDELGRGGTAAEGAAISACSLLEYAIQEALPGIESRDGLWQAIRSLADASAPDHDPDLEGFENAVNTRMPIDVLNMSIDSLAARSFLVMVMYVAWCHGQTGRVEIAPEARAVLDRYLGGTRTVYRDVALGFCLNVLHFLDKDWTMKMVDEIRKNDYEMIAFWNGYVMWNDPDRRVFSDLLDVYNDFLTGGMSEMLVERGTFKSTLDHYISAYLYDYEKSGIDFDPFLNSIKDDSEYLIDCCVSRVAEVVHKIGDPSSFSVKRLKRLWRHEVFSKQDLTHWFAGSRVGEESVSMYLEYIRMYLKYIRGCGGTLPLLYPILVELESHADKSPEPVTDTLICLVEDGMNPGDKDQVDSIIAILDGHADRLGDKLKKLRELVDHSTNHTSSRAP